MPIYEFRCTACGHRFECWQKMADPDPDQCPECEKREVERVISAVGFRLKGSGWYETDFKKSGQRNIAGASEAGGDGAKKTDADKKDEKKSAGREKSATKPDSGKSAGKKSDTAA